MKLGYNPHLQYLYRVEQASQDSIFIISSRSQLYLYMYHFYLFIFLFFFIFRFITVLYYLNDVEEGGETAFPVADNETFDQQVSCTHGTNNDNCTGSPQIWPPLLLHGSFCKRWPF